MVEKERNQSQVHSTPKSFWWPFWIGLVAFVAGPCVWVFVTLTRPESDQGADNVVAVPNVGILSFILSIVGLILALRALRQGQRSNALVIGTILSGLALCYFAYIGISHLVG